jgi:hypothetical protein
VARDHEGGRVGVLRQPQRRELLDGRHGAAAGHRARAGGPAVLCGKRLSRLDVLQVLSAIRNLRFDKHVR